MGNLYDFVFAEVQVRASTLGAQAKGVLLNLLGFASGTGDTDAEVSAGEPAWGTPGVYCRPLDADGTGCAEYVAARGVDNLIPLAGRDLRITQARGAGGNVPKGTVGLAGYGGAYVEIAYDPATEKDVVTVKNGTLALVLDPIQRKVTVADGDLSVVLDANTERISLSQPQGVVVLLPSGVQAAHFPGGGVSASVTLTDTAAALSYIAPGVAVSVSCDVTGSLLILAPGGVKVNGVPLVVP